MKPTQFGAVAAAAIFAIASVAFGTTAASATPTAVVLGPGQVDLTGTLSAGHAEFLNNGLRVYTDNASAQALSVGTISLGFNGLPLSGVGNPSFGWSGTGPAPALRLQIDFDDDGTVDGTLVGVNTNAGGTDWWLTDDSAQVDKNRAPSCPPGFTNPSQCTADAFSPYHGTLAQWSTAFPAAVIHTVGYQLGPNQQGDGTISNIAIGSTNYTFTDSIAATVTVHSPYQQGGIDNGVTLDTSGSGSAGHSKFLASSLHVYTDDASANAYAVGTWDTGSTLGYAGEPQMTYTPDSGASPPGFILNVDFNGDGSVDGTLELQQALYGQDAYLTPGAKTFVQDGAPSCPPNFSSPSQCTGGSGSPFHGTLQQWELAFPQARFLSVGYALGPDVQADYQITSMTLGRTQFVFANTPPEPCYRGDGNGECFGGVVMGPNTTASFDFTPAYDADGDPVMYGPVTGPSHGTATVSGTHVVYTPNRGYFGQDSITIGLSDGISTPDSTQVIAITVQKTSTVMTFTKTPAGTTTSPRFPVTVTATVNGLPPDNGGDFAKPVFVPGNPNGGTVTFHYDTISSGPKTATATVVNGKASFTEPANVYGGVHHITATYSGNGATTSSTGLTYFIVSKLTATMAIPHSGVRGSNSTTLRVYVSPAGSLTNGGRLSVAGLGSAPVINGVATLTLPLESGTQKRTFTYSGSPYTLSLKELLTYTVT